MAEFYTSIVCLVQKLYVNLFENIKNLSENPIHSMEELGEELVINGASLSEHGNWPYSAEELSHTSCYRVYWVGQQRKDYFAI